MAFGGALLAFSAILPEVLLWFLGHSYAHLRSELPLMMGMAALNALAGAMWAINSAKAWIEYSWTYIPATLVTQGILFLTMDVSTLRGAIVFGIISLIPSIALNAWLTVRGLRRVDPEVTHTA